MSEQAPVNWDEIDQLEGSDMAKERAKVILATMNGDSSIEEACMRLGVSEPVFEELRHQMVNAMLSVMERETA